MRLRFYSVWAVLFGWCIVWQWLCVVGFSSTGIGRSEWLANITTINRCGGNRTINTGSSVDHGDIYWLFAGGKFRRNCRNDRDLFAILFVGEHSEFLGDALGPIDWISSLSHGCYCRIVGIDGGGDGDIGSIEFGRWLDCGDFSFGGDLNFEV